MNTKTIESIAKSANEVNQPVYLIGGYVRDIFLNRKSQDLDFVTIGSAKELATTIAKKLNIKEVAHFKNFGTAMIKYGGQELQFVAARKESYRHDSRNPVVENGSLEDDQNRRDFTINALAISLNKESYGQLSDPFNGLKDLKDEILKTPLNPDVTFCDDPLRMLRAIRFAAQLNFTIDERTFQSISKNNQRIEIVSKERVTEELQKIIGSINPSYGFKLLDKSGLLNLIFPEFSLLKGVEVINGMAHKDNFYHTLNVLDNLLPYSENNIWLRWGALLHDIAKPATKRFNVKTGWTFHGHEDKGARMVPKIFKKLKLPLDHKMKYVQKLVQLHLRPIALTKKEITDSAIRRLLFDAGEDLEDLMILCRADITSKNKEKVKRYLSRFDIVEEKLKDLEERDKIRNWQPPITGKQIMEIFNLKPSKEVGILKDAVREAILDGDIENDYQSAINFIIKKGKEIGLNTST
ncbi:MAG: tRNA nucleotidyltransferase [Crocinitomicaceae bacterium]|nr:tRNA nucleotidyltransferase [Crocinitomicaceae bacterium]